MFLSCTGKSLRQLASGSILSASRCLPLGETRQLLAAGADDYRRHWQFEHYVMSGLCLVCREVKV